MLQLWAAAVLALGCSGAFARPQARANVQSLAAQTCLSSDTSLVVVTQCDNNYSSDASPFNLRLTPSPNLIIYPTSVAQIQEAVKCAASSNMTVTARSGGHSYAAYALSGQMVIDMSKLKSLSVDSSGTAVAQTGLRLGELATGIWNQGQRALPHGTCPYVGTGGHALFGGYGYLGRSQGLLLDHVVGADVVLADGSAVHASSSSNTDLFWALRGGGPSFGIVTAWTFATLPAPPTTVYYELSASSTPSTSEVISAFEAWQSFCGTSPDQSLSTTIVFGTDGNGGVSMQFSGEYYGTMDAFHTALGPLQSSLPSKFSLTKAESLGWMDALSATDGSLDTSQPDGHDTFLAKSLITNKALSNSAITSWVNYMANQGSSTDAAWFAIAELYGGNSAITSVPQDATAFAHRDAFLVFQLYAYSQGSQPPFPSDGTSFINNMLTALEPNPQAAYPNYMDPTLTQAQSEAQYFGSHITRLRQIKTSVDPKDVFHVPQGILPA